MIPFSVVSVPIDRQGFGQKLQGIGRWKGNSPTVKQSNIKCQKECTSLAQGSFWSTLLLCSWRHSSKHLEVISVHNSNTKKSTYVQWNEESTLSTDSFQDQIHSWTEASIPNPFREWHNVGANLHLFPEWPQNRLPLKIYETLRSDSRKNTLPLDLIHIDLNFCLSLTL